MTSHVAARVTAEVTAQVAAAFQRYKTTEAGLAMATGHASGRAPVSGSLAPDSGRKGGPSRTEKGKGRQ